MKCSEMICSFILVFALSFTLSCTSGDEGGGKGNNIANYKTKKIGSQTWMAENLNYAAAGSKCYENKESNCDKYGRLYDWNLARIVCPTGWHLPSQAEWNVLINYIQNNKDCTICDANHLKSASGWYNNSGGSDSYGFSAKPGGYGGIDSVGIDSVYLYFKMIGHDGYFWTANEYSSSYGQGRYINYNIPDSRWSYYERSNLFSVRCVQD